ncbi:uncharacterized protein LOC110724011 [Chenopodium quinoa]|uniref:uncharacterized protein LOC110724011 n=1 Tax=Chenopodium quinoa TaxID=63459 RepID=UPI000B778FC3|nr:uncharacterized protein LOC110724011 [Chenopodium quinoa]
MRDFKHLKSMVLSKGFVNIFIKDKSKKSTPIEASIDNTSSTPSHGTGKNTHEAGKRRRKHVINGPNRRDVPIVNWYNKEFDEKLQSTKIGKNANENANTADEHALYEVQEIPTSVRNKCPSLSCKVARYVKIIENCQGINENGLKIRGSDIC